MVKLFCLFLKMSLGRFLENCGIFVTHQLHSDFITLPTAYFEKLAISMLTLLTSMLGRFCFCRLGIRMILINDGVLEHIFSATIDNEPFESEYLNWHFHILKLDELLRIYNVIEIMFIEFLFKLP